MNSKYWKIVGLVILFSFAWGAWWGFYRHERANQADKHGPEIRLLVQKHFLSDDFIKDLQKKLNVDLQVTQVDNEIDLLRELLSHNQNYDLVELPSFVLKSFLIDNVLAPINPKKIPELTQVSVDFRNLDFDPDNRYLVPITWGVTGFVVNKSKLSWPDHSLKTLFTSDAKIAALNSPVEFLNLAAKVQPIVSTWIKTGQIADLTKTVKQVAGQVSEFSSDATPLLTNGDVQVAQMDNGQAAAFLAKNSGYKFILPEEKGVMWIHFMAISRGVNDIELAHEVLNTLLQPAVNKRLVEINQVASVLNSLNGSDLPEMQKARYIREVSLSRFELYVSREAIDPIWLNIYKQTVKAAK